jgi:LysR family cys regulon transcriptional activator
MNIQQLRYVSEVAKRGTERLGGGQRLHTSQPGVSKQIRALEEELGSEIFVRQAGASPPSPMRVARSCRRSTASSPDVANLKSVGAEFAHRAKGTLAVGVTHTQARYALPPIVTRFKKRFPDVKLKLLQGNPHQLARMVVTGEADVSIATEAARRIRRARHGGRAIDGTTASWCRTAIRSRKCTRSRSRRSRSIRS